MYRFVYLLFGLIVVIVSTTANLGYLRDNTSSPSSWGGRSWGSGGGFSGGHK